jgi:hypothetical protein
MSGKMPNHRIFGACDLGFIDETLACGDLVSMQSTSLKLLCSDGGCTVTFTPLLTSDQYNELLAIVELDISLAELADYLEKVAAKWRVRLDIEAC